MRPKLCRCGFTLDLDEARFVGAQPTDVPGEYLALYQCSSCSTTVSAETIRDATRCMGPGCDHLITGESDDPKICHEMGEVPTKPMWRILCFDCWRAAMGYLPRFVLPRRQVTSRPAGCER